MAQVAQAPASGRPANTTLLTLPGEIRNMIYEYVSEPTDITKRQGHAPAAPTYDINLDGYVRTDMPPITRVCRQLRSEFLSSWVPKHTFRALVYRDARRWVSKMSDDTLDKVRDLVLTVDFTARTTTIVGSVAVLTYRNDDDTTVARSLVVHYSSRTSTATCFTVAQDNAIVDKVWSWPLNKHLGPRMVVDLATFVKYYANRGRGYWRLVDRSVGALYNWIEVEDTRVSRQIYYGYK